jgi:hypothetical protein
VRSLIEVDSTLLVQAPAWLGLLLIGLAIALTVLALVGRPPRVARLGAFLGTLMLLYVGWHAHAQRVTFEQRGFYVDGLYGEEERVGWLTVSDVNAAGLTGGKGEPGHLVFQLRNSRDVSVDLSDLDGAEHARILAYVKSRLKPK